MFRSSRPLVIATAGALALTLAGCSTTASGTASASAGASTNGTTIRIVASTNVYGDIATQIGGSAVSVTSIIDDPDKDPHEYQADAQNQLALSKAQIVIENGGGYDDFVDTMLSSANNASASVLNVAKISGYDQHPATGDFNEHLWYDFPTVAALTAQLTSALKTLDPADAATFDTNAAAFTAQLNALEQQEASAKATDSGKGAAITEPVPLYMLDAMGFVNKTPEAFSAAIEGGTDVAPDVLQQTLDLFSTHEVQLLAYNSQTSGPQTEAVLNAAQTAGVAVVPVTETLPAGKTYIEWMTDNVTALANAAK